MVTPAGKAPTGIVAIENVGSLVAFVASRSHTRPGTSTLEESTVTYARSPAGVKAMECGLDPKENDAATVFVAVSMIWSFWLDQFATQTCDPPGRTATPNAPPPPAPRAPLPWSAARAR